MAYLQPTPRRRKQAVPNMQQMIRRRAASPGGIPPMGAPLQGAPAAPVRRLGTYTGNPIFHDTRQNRSIFSGNNPGLGHEAGTPLRRDTYDLGYRQTADASGPPSQLGGPTGGPENSFGPGAPTQSQNPNSLLGVGGDNRHPLQHLQYWESQGWTYNPTTGRFHQGKPGGAKAGQPPQGSGLGGGRPNPGPGGPGDGGHNPPGGGGPGGGGSGSGGGSGGGTPAPLPPSTQLPLDAYFEAQQRALNDVLQARLAPLGPGREQLAADQALQSARLNTNMGVDQRHLDESLAGRGAWGGGIQRRDNGYLGTDYLRQRQDLASQVAQGYAGYGQQESAANAEYQQGLMEALMELANRQSTSQYAVTPHPGATLPANGGGGQHWQPTWQPKWSPKGRR